jgi:hypothetical protein
VQGSRQGFAREKAGDDIIYRPGDGTKPPRLKSDKAPRVKKEKVTAEVKADAVPKSNIRVIWTSRPVRLIDEGEQCSEIHWLDTGTRQALPNDQWERIRK